jgi:hypothetical protein
LQDNKIPRRFGCNKALHQYQSAKNEQQRPSFSRGDGGKRNILLSRIPFLAQKLWLLNKGNFSLYKGIKVAFYDVEGNIL